MKRILLLIASICLIGAASVNGQNHMEFKSFTFTKGYVKANKNFYKKCSFSIEPKKGAEVIVDLVEVNGIEAKLTAIQMDGKTIYTVEVPPGVKVPVGTQFDVKIVFGKAGGGGGGFVMGLMDSTEGKVGSGDSSRIEAGGPGGPGSGGDPTVIVIKYP